MARVDLRHHDGADTVVFISEDVISVIAAGMASRCVFIETQKD